MFFAQFLSRLRRSIEQVRTNNPQHVQWLLRPPVLLIAIIFSLYLMAAITTPLNIDSMNALDGKPIIRVQPFRSSSQKTKFDINVNGTFPTSAMKDMMTKDMGVAGKVVNATSDMLVYKNVGGKRIPMGIDGAKVSQTAIRNRGAIQRFVPLSLFIVVGLIGIQIAKYYMMRRRSFTDGIGGTQFGGLAARSALSRLLREPNVTRGLSHRLRNMSEADRVRLQLALSSRDFTGDDYERLLQLDSAGLNRGATEGQINRLPTSIYSSGTASSSSSNHSSPCRNRADMDSNALVRRENSGSTSSCGDCSSISSVNNEWKDIDIDDREREGERLTVRPTQCAICLEPYQDGDELRTVMCLHRFHKNCIDQWLRTNCICPICKQRSVE